MGRYYSRLGHTTQLRSEHVLEECPFLTESLYPTRVSGTWGVRGLARMIFDPGGIRYSYSFNRSAFGMSSCMQRSSTSRLCYSLQVRLLFFWYSWNWSYMECVGSIL